MKSTIQSLEYHHWSKSEHKRSSLPEAILNFFKLFPAFLSKIVNTCFTEQCEVSKLLLMCRIFLALIS